MVVAGALTAAIGAGALAGGGALVAVNETQRDGAGFYAAEARTLATPTRALVSHDLDVGDAGPDWLLAEGRLGRVRVAATGTRDGPVFVGIARRAPTSTPTSPACPRSSPTSTAARAAATTGGGTGAPAPPASRGFWEKSAAGAGLRPSSGPSRRATGRRW